ncbi:MAG TPA: DUF308 domain-containing protein [Nocardioides sp.]|uniref:HdeD family acid-resistance protein n=1 Tax=uncultured Nocardioides sp. TaxID=198441 RepID=UPI000ED6A79A|nr:DUF308 domain-containing protein [uncultured Nocardioides sp.]HCB05211.1 hypothetical protein [Nocardioides sp.]HRD59691.1 DUF308 domain-containing protein [Nocardioides sp.]HRI96884.1 DUF308 domain-containing protein [Nocardioides sp.]HRK45220.1 DUF308 domain-containing protein [Nocardioides sp.]
MVGETTTSFGVAFTKPDWKSLLVRGLVAAAIGIAVMVWPDITLKILVILVGIWVLIDGIGLIVAAFRAESGAAKGLYGLLGLLALVAAFFCIFRPGVAASTVIWVLGVWLIIRGLFELFAAFGSGLGMPRWLALLGAVVDFVLGIVFVTHPDKSATGLSWLFGLFILLGGILLVSLAFVARKDPSGPSAL